MKRVAIALLILTLEIVMTVTAVASDSLAVGAQAPDFSLPYATRDSIASESLTLSREVAKGPILLAFYPADWSGGCTKEVCTFRDDFANLQKLGIRIWAISGDYVYSHLEWAKHHNLPFELLTDHDHAVARLYNSYDAEELFNKRTIYVVDSHGKIAFINPKYRAREEADFTALKAALGKIR
ncbi:MAG: peroxiredoxin [candidate division Zixibacteria bacterium]|nr:peroxiredoxin [candidate division Zixibacteria bacterium]